MLLECKVFIDIVLTPFLHNLYGSFIELKSRNLILKRGDTRREHKRKAERFILFTGDWLVWNFLHFWVPYGLLRFSLLIYVFIFFLLVHLSATLPLNHPTIVGELFILFAFDFDFLRTVVYLGFDVITTKSLLRRLPRFAELKLFHPFGPIECFSLFFEPWPDKDTLIGSHLVSTGDRGIDQSLYGTRFRNWRPNHVREAQNPVRGYSLLESRALAWLLRLFGLHYHLPQLTALVWNNIIDKLWLLSLSCLIDFFKFWFGGLIAVGVRSPLVQKLLLM